MLLEGADNTLFYQEVDLSGPSSHSAVLFQAQGETCPFYFFSVSTQASPLLILYISRDAYFIHFLSQNETKQNHNGKYFVADNQYVVEYKIKLQSFLRLD